MGTISTFEQCPYCKITDIMHSEVNYRTGEKSEICLACGYFSETSVVLDKKGNPQFNEDGTFRMKHEESGHPYGIVKINSDHGLSLHPLKYSYQLKYFHKDNLRPECLTVDLHRFVRGKLVAKTLYRREQQPA